MLPQLVKLKRIALDLLFPCWCIGCGREGSLICPSCQRKLPPIEPPLCPQCGIPQPDGILCFICLNQKYAIDGIRSPFRFEGVVRQVIHHLKYKNLRTAAEPAAELLWFYLAGNPISGEVLTPVPLHRKRLRERGYNQSELLARELSKTQTGGTVYMLETASYAVSMPLRRQGRHLQAKDTKTSPAPLAVAMAASRIKR